MKVIIYCVNYNSYDELKNYLESLNNALVNSSVELSVVVIDNSQKMQDIQDKYLFELIHLKLGENLGYFGGAEYGIKNCGKNINDFDYSIISNVDLQVQEDFFIQLSALGVDESIGCVAPCIYSIGENRNRNPKVLSRYSLKKLQLLRLLYKYPVLNFIYTTVFFSKHRKKVEESNQEIIYAAHGSFMLFTKKFYDFIENMSYPVFLFGEELYIAENLRSRGLKTIYEPNLVVNDTDHASTSKMKSKFYYKCNFEAIDMIIKEYYNE